MNNVTCAYLMEFAAEKKMGEGVGGEGGSEKEEEKIHC